MSDPLIRQLREHAGMLFDVEECPTAEEFLDEEEYGERGELDEGGVRDWMGRLNATLDVMTKLMVSLDERIARLEEERCRASPASSKSTSPSSPA